MKRKMMILMSLTALVTLFSFVPAIAAPVVTLELPTDPLAVGDTFDMNVIADGVESDDSLIGFGFDLSYDNSQFSYNGATVASPFSDTSGSFAETDVAGFGFPAVSGDDILLASLSFTPQSAGDFSLGIVSDVNNPNEGLITIWNQTDMSTEASVRVVPIPGAVWLFASGLAGLAGIRRKLRG